MKLIHEGIKPYIGYLLILIMAFMIGRERTWKRRLLSLMVFFRRI